MKYIYHHMGLGDHIICNGMVRYFQEKYKKVSVFCKSHYSTQVQYMYRDNQDIEVLPLTGDREVVEYIERNHIQDATLTVGFQKLFWNFKNLFRFPKYKKFDEGFYKSVGLPFTIRFDYFFLLRDLEKEKKIFQELNPDGEEYIFTHGVDRKRVRSDLKIIENPLQHSPFDLMYLIENAVEVHVMESSIKNLINSYKVDKPKLFYHQYVRRGEYIFYFCDSQGLNTYRTIY